jgi:hypothetical protein
MKPSPIFVAQFLDGEVTRMTTWQDPGRKTFDFARGVTLAQHAYRSRTRRKPPAIKMAHFEDKDGNILERMPDRAGEPAA